MNSEEGDIDSEDCSDSLLPGLSYVDVLGAGALIVISFDPGVTTGWAVHRLDLKSLLKEGFTRSIWNSSSGWVCGEIGGDGLGEDAAVDSMMNLTRIAYSLGDYAYDVFAIVMEDFVPRMLEQKRSFLSPVRVFAKYERDLYQARLLSGLALPYFKQSASDAKNVVTDDRLTRWQLYRAGSVHSRDAQRHGVLFARKVSSDPTLFDWLVRHCKTETRRMEENNE